MVMGRRVVRNKKDGRRGRPVLQGNGLLDRKASLQRLALRDQALAAEAFVFNAPWACLTRAAKATLSAIAISES